MRGPRGKINRVKPGHEPWNKGKTKNTDEKVAKMAVKRAAAGNSHLIGVKRPKEICEKIRSSQIGKIMTSEQVDKMSLAKKDKTWEEIFGEEGAKKRRAELKMRLSKNHHKAKKVSTPYGIYDSASAAARELNVDSQTVLDRCRKTSEKWKDWYLLEDISI